MPDPTEGAPSYVETDDGLADFTAEDFQLYPGAEALPDLTDLPGRYPAPPPEEPAGQDSEAGEGRGFGSEVPAFVRPTADALALAVACVTNRTRTEVGRCLQRTREFWNVAPYYLAAKDSLQGAIELGVAHRVEFSAAGVLRIPRGVAVYFRGPNSQYGHIGPTLGAGAMVSSDWPTGYFGRVNIYVLAKAWGYTEIWWAPAVNDVRVWRRAPKPSPTPLVTRWLADRDNDKLLARLAEDGDGARPEEVKAAARRIIDGRSDRERGHNLMARAARKTKVGRQALRELEVER